MLLSSGISMLYSLSFAKMLQVEKAEELGRGHCWQLTDFLL